MSNPPIDPEYQWLKDPTGDVGPVLCTLGVGGQEVLARVSRSDVIQWLSGEADRVNISKAIAMRSSERGVISGMFPTFTPPDSVGTLLVIASYLFPHNPANNVHQRSIDQYERLLKQISARASNLIVPN